MNHFCLVQWTYKVLGQPLIKIKTKYMYVKSFYGLKSNSTPLPRLGCGVLGLCYFSPAPSPLTAPVSIFQLLNQSTICQTVAHSNIWSYSAVHVCTHTFPRRRRRRKNSLYFNILVDVKINTASHQDWFLKFFYTEDLGCQDLFVGDCHQQIVE